MATIIEDPHRCTFIHIPKTGGNSITQWMTENFDVKITKRKQHATVSEVMQGNHSLGPVTDLGWKFCVVRNPWDYLVSWYTFKVMLCEKYIDMVENDPSLANLKKDKYNIELQQKELERLNQGFDWWIRQTGRKPQHYWAKDCDYIMKLENLNKDFKVVQKKLNCKIPLGHLNKTEGREKDYRKYYTKETREIVANQYAIDIETYNYQF